MSALHTLLMPLTLLLGFKISRSEWCFLSLFISQRNGLRNGLRNWFKSIPWSQENEVRACCYVSFGLCLGVILNRKFIFFIEWGIFVTSLLAINHCLLVQSTCSVLFDSRHFLMLFMMDGLASITLLFSLTWSVQKVSHHSSSSLPVPFSWKRTRPNTEK